MSQKTVVQVESALCCAKGSLAVEGLTLTAKQEQLVKDQLLGNVSHEAFVKQALKLSRHG
ncbi:hypothetical protein [Paenalkalicoccus suaedae]|uniref:hypothetical protein n=1 Tax=Paenalkalicoccus suaedae TaxID=2592382 RepID=UPI00201BBA59|nr:hypothetical protein [Paenalkalicoccus suaedae]